MNRPMPTPVATSLPTCAGFVEGVGSDWPRWPQIEPECWPLGLSRLRTIGVHGAVSGFLDAVLRRTTREATHSIVLRVVDELRSTLTADDQSRPRDVFGSRSRMHQLVLWCRPLGFSHLAVDALRPRSVVVSADSSFLRNGITSEEGPQPLTADRRARCTRIAGLGLVCWAVAVLGVGQEASTGQGSGITGHGGTRRTVRGPR